jgi:hypothetical protein
MCKFEDVKMCRFGKHFAVSIFMIMWFSTTVNSQTNINWNIQSPIVHNFVHRLEYQPLDSLLPFLSKELQEDSATKADLQEATAYLKRVSCKCEWQIMRFATGYECRYGDDNRSRLIVYVTFGEGQLLKTISKIKIYDEAGMKKNGIETSPIPPPPPPPPSPKPR